MLGILFRLSPLDTKQSKTLLIDVPKGKTFYQLAKELKEKNLIHSERDFKVLIWFLGRPHLKQGEYELSSNMSLWKILTILKEGRERSFKVSFPEGFNHYEMAELLKSLNYPSADRFLYLVWDKKFIQKNLNQDLDSLEGYLFPDSYYLKKYQPVEQLIESMIQNFSKTYRGNFRI